VDALDRLIASELIFITWGKYSGKAKISNHRSRVVDVQSIGRSKGAEFSLLAVVGSLQVGQHLPGSAFEIPDLRYTACGKLAAPMCGRVAAGHNAVDAGVALGLVQSLSRL
jgi:hypothetical protein